MPVFLLALCVLSITLIILSGARQINEIRQNTDKVASWVNENGLKGAEMEAIFVEAHQIGDKHPGYKPCTIKLAEPTIKIDSPTLMPKPELVGKPFFARYKGPDPKPGQRVMVSVEDGEFTVTPPS